MIKFQHVFEDDRNKRTHPYICIQKDRTRNGLEFLFARFKRFRRLHVHTLSDLDDKVFIDHILDLVSKDVYNPVEVVELKFGSRYSNFCILSPLISYFSPLIKKLYVSILQFVKQRIRFMVYWKLILLKYTHSVHISISCGKVWKPRGVRPSPTGEALLPYFCDTVWWCK